MSEQLDIKVRLAQDSEREIVAQLVSETFHDPEWSPKFERVFPYWLVAEVAGEIVGTINLRISVPFSSLEMLVIDPRLTRRTRRNVFTMLLDTGRAICAASGAEMISAMISDDDPDFLEWLVQHGYFVGNRGSIVFGRIR